MQNRGISIRLLILAALSGCQAGVSVQPIPGMALSGAFPDHCTRIDGYAMFRTRLIDAVRRRDEAAFRALFSARGTMRVNGLGGGSGASWRMDSPEGARVWEDLDQILSLGCGVENGRLFLPYTALVPEPLESDRQLVAVRTTSLRAAPREDAPVLATAPRGALLPVTEHPPTPAEGWIYVSLGGGRFAYAREVDLRSTADTALEVVNEGGDWRIVSYTGND